MVTSDMCACDVEMLLRISVRPAAKQFNIALERWDIKA
jgi:uncharacterized protein YggU (UPF0235/DUF167 family)